MLLPLQLIIFIIFIVNATIAGSFAVKFGMEKKPKLKTNYLVIFIYVSSIIWSLGMGLMSLQSSHKGMYLWRTFGIFGTFMFMMSVQKILCVISEIETKKQIILNGISYAGLLVFILYIQPGQTIFVQTNIGVSFYFKPGIVNILYSIYFFIVSFNILMVTIHMLRNHKLLRVRTIAKRFLIVEVLIFMGAIADMVVPSMGMVAFPGSAITHFWGVFVFWFAIHGMYKSQITIANMSEYIYYSLGIPLIVFDANKKIRIINDASNVFFDIASWDVEHQSYYISDLFNVGREVFEFDERNTYREVICNQNEANCGISISKIQDSYGDVIGYIVIVNDLTEHHLAMKRLEQAKLEADAANMSKSVFLANMSHEIRTPMNAIIGFADLALKDNIDETAKEYISDMKRSGDTLLSIINDILNISKIELGKHELTCANYKPASIFNDVSIIIGIQAKEKNLSFDMNIAKDFPDELYGDKDKIREILINLLNNSVKYTKAGGLKLEVECEPLENGMSMVTYCVSDTGIGIKPEDIDAIFEKFKRMDAKINSETEGTGLGLSITKGLIEMMGGTIKVESTYGIGSKFTVKLPQKVINQAPIQKEEISSTTQTANKKLHFSNVKFLAVDDNKVNLKVIGKIMERYEITYDIADSGKEAIDLCKANAYDVVLMDQMMPVMDGVEAMQHIRLLEGYEKGSDQKIVALTANVVEGVKEELMKDGFDDFIGKPINLTMFENAMVRVLDESKYYFTEE